MTITHTYKTQSEQKLHYSRLLQNLNHSFTQLQNLNHSFTQLFYSGLLFRLSFKEWIFLPSKLWHKPCCINCFFNFSVNVSLISCIAILTRKKNKNLTHDTYNFPISLLPLKLTVGFFVPRSCDIMFLYELCLGLKTLNFACNCADRSVNLKKPQSSLYPIYLKSHHGPQRLN